MVLCLLWQLAPARAGYGTHRQLGLPSCGYLARTGYPCPGCGVTTALAAMAHGRLARAWQAQPFGVAMFAAVVLVGLVGLAQLICGRDLLGRVRPRWWWLGPVVLAWLGGWAYKLLTGLASGRYPLGR